MIIKLDYFTLLSPTPVLLDRIGSIKSPLLSEISDITFSVYNKYVSLLLMDMDTYFNTIDKLQDLYFHGLPQSEIDAIKKIKLKYETHNIEEKGKISFYDVIAIDSKMRQSIIESLNFFLVDDVSFDSNHRVFVTYNGTLDEHKNKVITGCINENIYSEFIDVILQRINIKNQTTKIERPKNKKAAQILEKFKKANETKTKQENHQYELANIISSLAVHHKSLNMKNIWDLTVYQLYDQFTRQRFEDSYDIQALSVAAYGDSEGKFDDTQWFSLIHKD